jgi:hypothetical protein
MYGLAIKKSFTLGYNRSSDGYVTDTSFGQIVVSMVFRPVSSVQRSGIKSFKEMIFCIYF